MGDLLMQCFSTSDFSTAWTTLRWQWLYFENFANL